MIEVKKFFGTWCAPCRMLDPIIESVKNKVDSNVKFSYIDIDENQQLAQKYGVRSVPTVVIEKNGQEVGRILGVQSEMKYLNEINNT